jgi:hypothetical protein
LNDNAAARDVHDQEQQLPADIVVTSVVAGLVRILNRAMLEGDCCLPSAAKCAVVKTTDSFRRATPRNAFIPDKSPVSGTEHPCV